MADLKITQLPLQNTLVSGAIFVVVNDPAGTPATQKITIDSIAEYLPSAMTFDTLQFNTLAAASVAVGQLAWNADEGTIDVGLLGGNVVNQLGQELHQYVKATEAVTDGEIVYASGAVGASGHIEVSKYIANNTIDELYVIGIATESISLGGFGFITTFGKVRGIQTDGVNYGETWVDGEILYASPTTAGAYTKVLPVAPNQAIPVAMVLTAHATNGTIMVRPSHGFHIGELHNVYENLVADQHVLIYDFANSRYENRSLLESDISDFGTYLGNVVEDITPQLGGALDVVTNSIFTSTVNGGITIAPDGSGIVSIINGGTTTQSNLYIASGAGYIDQYVQSNGQNVIKQHSWDAAEAETWVEQGITYYSLSDNSGYFFLNASAGQLNFGATNTGALGATLLMEHNSSSPAANDVIGRTIYRGKDSLANNTEYVHVEGRIGSPTDTSEDGDYMIRLLQNNVMTDVFYLDGSVNNAYLYSDLLTIGGNNTSAGLSIITSGNPNTFFEHNSTNNSIYWTSTVGGSYGELAYYNNQAYLTMIGKGTGDGQVWHYYRGESATPAVGDVLFYMEMAGKNSIAGNHSYAKIDARIVSPTSTTEDGELVIQASVAGTLKDILKVGQKVSINSDSTGTTGAVLDLYQNSASPAVGDIVGAIDFYGEDASSNKTRYGAIQTKIQDTTASNEFTKMVFLGLSNGGLDTEMMSLITSGASATLRVSSGGTIQIGTQPINLQLESVASGTTITPDTAGERTLSKVTALAANLTVNAPTNPGDGHSLIIRIKDNGTSRTLTWNAIFRAIGSTLPVATTANKTIYVGCIYNTSDAKWDVIAVNEEA